MSYAHLHDALSIGHPLKTAPPPLLDPQRKKQDNGAQRADL